MTGCSNGDKLMLSLISKVLDLFEEYVQKNNPYPSFEAKV